MTTTPRIANLLAITSLLIANPLFAENWEGATVEEQLVDDAAELSNMALSMAESATRNGSRVAKVEGDTTDGFSVRVDGKPGTPYDQIALPSPLFSENGSSVAYCARRGTRWHWVVNGVEGPGFPKLTASSFAFSADGKRYAYVAMPSLREKSLVVDGVVGPAAGEDQPAPFDAAPIFSPDGKRLAFVETMRTPRKMRVNLDQQPGPWHSGIAMATSPGVGAYSAFGGGQQRPKVAGMKFSPDSKHFAYTAFVNGGQCHFIDGAPEPVHEALGFDFVFSPAGGTRHAYLAFDGPDQTIVRSFGEPLPVKAMSDWTLTFSPDGEHLAFAGVLASAPGVWGVWLDGKPAPCDLAISMTQNAGSVRFSPDSKRLAFIVESSGTLHWVVDGKAGPGTTGGMARFDFSPDSAHFAYAMKRGETGDSSVVVDGKVRASYAGVACGPVFLNDGTLEFLAIKGDTLVKYRIKGY
jgi:hypothetical protein